MDEKEEVLGMIFNKRNIKRLKNYFDNMIPNQVKELEEKTEIQSCKDVSSKQTL